MIRTIEKYIVDNRLLQKSDGVVVGVSGGADSVCLAWMLLSLGYRVVVVHCNFHLRGEESMRDERFVNELCKRWGVECVVVNFDTMAYATSKNISVEMAARELRYDFFEKTRKERRCAAIAVGHHRDDNIETMLLNLVRGTGIRGLCGIQPRNGFIVRPLLCVSREEIEAYLRGKGQDFVTDHTNLEDAYARNKVRLNVLPELARINSGVQGNIITTIENLCEVRKVYDDALCRAMDDCCNRGEDGSLCIDIERLLLTVSPMSVLHEVLSPLGFNRDQVKGVIKSIDRCGSVFQGATGATLLVDRKHIVVEPSSSARIYNNVSIEDVPELSMVVKDIADVVINRSNEYAYIDADKVRGVLTVRTPRQGDSFAPFGMGGKRKLLSDFLTDQKVNLLEKARQLLVCDGDEIVWVVGRRSSELYRVTGKTERVIILGGFYKLPP